MNALLKSDTQPSNHYWMLWISPNASQMQQIKQLSTDEQQRVLMLHPKKPEQLCNALEIAITSGNYLSITLDRAIIPARQQQTLELLALRNHTHINWLTRRPAMNSASQLTLI
ncbi:hypothetical protein QNI23_008875 [Bermanella sp. WJH001]|uniref:hypothetical protein n=1 Tax=Bermanella sp. WJH001 TaxID=3048005 RepID=UPI0024BEF20C|nr:hypothetical protein [Bermanella sp. WJH001]MDJ1537104.1 hypothetical protein [Bermanella sp. WJH001]